MRGSSGRPPTRRRLSQSSRGYASTAPPWCAAWNVARGQMGGPTWPTCYHAPAADDGHQPRREIYTAAALPLLAREPSTPRTAARRTWTPGQRPRRGPHDWPGCPCWCAIAAEGRRGGPDPERRRAAREGMAGAQPPTRPAVKALRFALQPSR